MVKTITALYAELTTAQQVVRDLIEAGFSGDDISLLLKTGESSPAEGEVSASEGIGFGALIGALVGVSTILIPGVGPVLSLGPLSVALTAGIGAAAGALTGGITAALLELGMNEQDAQDFADGLRRGGTVVTLTTQSHWIEWAENIMNRYMPLRLEERTPEGGSSGTFSRRRVSDSSTHLRLMTDSGTHKRGSF